MEDAKYYEVEGAVFRKLPGKKLEIYDGAGEYSDYTGDQSRIYRQSNVMTLDEVKPYME